MGPYDHAFLQRIVRDGLGIRKEHVMVRSILRRSGSVVLSLLLFALFGASHAWAQQNVFTPGDPIILVNGLNDGDANAGPPPGAEGVEHSIDRNTQKY